MYNYLFNYKKIIKNKIFFYLSTNNLKILSKIVYILSKKKSEFNHIDKLLFIHIPKCAGLSIKRSNNIKYGHITMSHYLCIFKKEVISYTILRDPIDRFCSAFYYLKEKLNSDFYTPVGFDKKIILDSVDVNDFINNIKNKNLTIKYIFLFDHFLPQYFWIYSNNKIKVKYIVNFSKLEQGINDLNEILNSNIKINCKVNVSTNHKNNKNLNKDSLYFLKKYYNQDFLLYKKISKFSVINTESFY